MVVIVPTAAAAANTVNLLIRQLHVIMCYACCIGTRNRSLSANIRHHSRYADAHIITLTKTNFHCSRDELY